MWAGIGLDVHHNDPAYDNIVALNQMIANHARFAFDPLTNPPHVNLYDFDAPKQNAERINSELAAIAEKHEPMRLTIKGIGFFPHGSIFVSLDLDDAVEKLEREIVEAINPLRGCRSTHEYWQPQRSYSPEQLINLKQYGNPHVLSTFVPHITVGYVPAKPDELDLVCKRLTECLGIASVSFTHLDSVFTDRKSPHATLRHTFPLGSERLS